MIFKNDTLQIKVWVEERGGNSLNFVFLKNYIFAKMNKFFLNGPLVCECPGMIGVKLASFPCEKQKRGLYRNWLNGRKNSNNPSHPSNP